MKQQTKYRQEKNMNQKFGLGIPEQPAASPELMDALRQLKCSRLLPDIGKLIDEREFPAISYSRSQEVR